MRADPRQLGQAATELVAIVPLVLAALLALAQLCVAGYALWSAGEAARNAARAAHVGAAPEPVARRAVPAVLGPAEVEAAGSRIEVEVRAPALLPGLPPLPVRAAAALEPEAAAAR